MWKSRQEIKDTYIDHLDSVRMSGLGHENSRSEILSVMLQTLKDFDAGNEILPFSILSR